MQPLGKDGSFLSITQYAESIMAENTSTITKTPSVNSTLKQPLVPPEEQFWKRYSPRHEFPLSAFASFALHAIAIVLMIIGAAILLKLGLSRDTEPLPIDALAIRPGGGGGSGQSGVGPGTGSGGEPVENLPDQPNPPEQVNVTPLADLPVVPIPETQLPELAKDPDARRFIERSTAAARELAKTRQDQRDKLMSGIAGRGQGGTGSDGGKDTGRDRGEGPGQGDGKLSVREKRVLRWTMMFDTVNGQDYMRQLAALGAILGIPRENGEYMIIRNLTPPATGQIEDVRQINRIFWIDSQPQSVQSLAGALRIPPPQHIVAFFPEALEQELLKMELNYRGLREDQIQETRFRVVRAGNRFFPQVVDQLAIGQR